MKLRTKFILIFLAVSVLPLIALVTLVIITQATGRPQRADTLLLLTFIVAVLGVYFSLQWANYVTRPIIAMAIITRKIGKGDFSARIKFESSDEIGELAAVFNQMASRIEEVDRIKSNFLHLAGHHLRTPQTIISGASKELAGRLSVGLTKDQKLFVDIIKGGVAELNDISETLLAVSSLQFGNNDLIVSAVDTNALIREVVNSYKKQIDEKDLKYNDSLPEKSVEISTDARLLRTVIVMLVRNAITFTKEGHIEIEVTAHQKNVTITIMDTGIGIPPDQLPYLFSEFYQADNAKEVHPTGKGLGLYMARLAVERLGGTIVAESQLGQGTNFMVTVPKQNTPQIELIDTAA